MWGGLYGWIYSAGDTQQNVVCEPPAAPVEQPGTAAGVLTWTADCPCGRLPVHDGVWSQSFMSQPKQPDVTCPYDKTEAA